MSSNARSRTVLFAELSRCQVLSNAWFIRFCAAASRHCRRGLVLRKASTSSAKTVKPSSESVEGGGSTAMDYGCGVGSDSDVPP